MILPPEVFQSESAKVALIALALPALGPVLKLVLVTGESIVQVVLLSVVGYVLAHRGILNKDTQRRLNRLNVSIFTPALLFSKVAFSLSTKGTGATPGQCAARIRAATAASPSGVT